MKWRYESKEVLLASVVVVNVGGLEVLEVDEELPEAVALLLVGGALC